MQLQRCRDLDASVASGIFTTVRSARNVPGQIDRLVSQKSQWVPPARTDHIIGVNQVDRIDDDVRIDDNDNDLPERDYESDSRINLPKTRAPLYQSATATSILPTTSSSSISIGKRKSTAPEFPSYPQHVTKSPYSKMELGIIGAFPTDTSSADMVWQLYCGAGTYRKAEQIRKKWRGVHLLLIILVCILLIYYSCLHLLIKL